MPIGHSPLRPPTPVHREGCRQALTDLRAIEPLSTSEPRRKCDGNQLPRYVPHLETTEVAALNGCPDDEEINNPCWAKDGWEAVRIYADFVDERRPELLVQDAYMRAFFAMLAVRVRPAVRLCMRAIGSQWQHLILAHLGGRRVRLSCGGTGCGGAWNH